MNYDANIVKNAQDNGLTLKQELFCRAVANGATQVDAARSAGYDLTTEHKPSMPSRMMHQERISRRVSELINAQNYLELAKNVWYDILSRESKSLKISDEIKIQELKLKTIDQIARLGEWEPEKISESKQLVVSANIRDMLPASKD